MSNLVKVRAVMTTGRHEISYARTWIEKSLREVGIPLACSFGVYYHQQMQKMFEDAVRDDLDYVLTIDGDSVFTGNQAHRLISLAANEQLDAVAAMQVRRGIATTLAYKKGQPTAVWSGYPLEVDAAHFGLTVISVKAIASTPKPWFCSKPDDKGEWGDNSVDADVFFWHQFKSAGHKVWCDCGCRIGHVEEMVVMHNEQMVPTHYYPKDWDKMMTEKKDDSHAKAMEEVSDGGSDRCPDPRCGGSACQSPESCRI